MYFDPDARDCPEQVTQDTTLSQIFFNNLYLFDSIFSITLSTNRLHDSDEGIRFPGLFWNFYQW